MDFRLEGNKLFLQKFGRRGEVVIDLTKMITANLYNLSLTRPMNVSEFEPRHPHPLADGLKIQLVNEDSGLFIPVIFRPYGDQGVRVIVKAGEIAEQLSINRKLMSIDLLPEFMKPHVGDDGFYLLPDRSGMLVRFREYRPTVSSDRIYMEQREWEKLNLMNCFGVADDSGGMLGIVNKGDFFCSCVTEINQDGENRIYPRFGLRHSPAEPVKQEDKELLVTPVDGAQPDYFDMAKVYRRYLVNELGVCPLRKRVQDNPVLAYSVDAMRTKIFHGLKRKSLDGNVPMNVYATFEQSERILDRMQEAGLKKAVITSVGWNLGGHDGAYPQRFPVEPELGGETGLKSLIGKAKKYGYQIVPHDNLTDIYMAGSMYDAEIALRTEDGTPQLGGIWGGGQAVKSCPLAYFDRYGPDVNRIQELGFEGHYYCDAQQNPLWRCHDPRHPADEQQFAISQVKLTQTYRNLYGAVSIEIAPAYALPFIDEAPMPFSYSDPRHFGKVGADLERIVDRMVPFYQLAVHGLITYQEGWVHKYRRNESAKKGLLRALSYGARPCMEVSYNSGANGDYFEDSIRDVQLGYDIAFNQLKGCHVEMVENYEELGEESAAITYENGMTYAANWSDHETAAGLEPLSYEVSKQ